MTIPKPSQYPKKVYLRGECYKIKFVKGMTCLGKTNPSKRLITIKHGMSRNETFKTFIHEILHFIEFEYPVTLKHKTVYALEGAIFDFLVDNFL